MLQAMLSKMCEEAGIERRTNHSLRATGDSQMFHANIAEKVIQSRTGHLSLKALRMYENPTDEQHAAACGVLVGAQKTAPSDQVMQTTGVRESNMQPVTSTVPAALFGSPQN